MQLKFANNNTINILKIDGYKSYQNNVNRNMIDIYVPITEGTFEQIINKFEKENLVTIELHENDTTYKHYGYTILIAASLKPVVITPTSFETEEVTENYYIITLGQQDKIYTDFNKLYIIIDEQSEMLADIIGGALQ